MKIASILDKDIVGDVGIELEAEFEAVRAPMPQYKDWVAKPEGSLRGTCMEYVSAQPFKADKHMREKINNLCSAINAPACRVIKDSPRTSIHVHTNILDLTPSQMFTFGLAYWSIENALFNYCGPKRKNNLFCLRLQDAPGGADYIASLLTGDGTNIFRNLDTDAIRYGGINWNAAPKFGSLEFRGMRGSTDPEIMHTWAMGLHELKINSTTNFKNPADLFDSFAVMDKEVYLGRLLSPEFAKIIKSYPGWTEGMEDNVLMLSVLAYSQNWEKFDSRFKAKKEPTPAQNGRLEGVLRHDLRNEIIDDLMEQPAPRPLDWQVLMDQQANPALDARMARMINVIGRANDRLN